MIRSFFNFYLGNNRENDLPALALNKIMRFLLALPIGLLQSRQRKRTKTAQKYLQTPVVQIFGCRSSP